MSKKIRKSSHTKTRRKDQDILKTRRFVRISHHKHTGRYLPIHFTSYALLFFVIALSCFVVFFARQKVVEAGGPPQTQSGSVQLTGVVPGPPPTTPAQITEPANNLHVTEPVLAVKGTCTAGLIVELYRNSAQAGSVICSNTGSFEIGVTLVAGENILKVRIRDSMSQYGPDSTEVTVVYDVPTPEEVVGSVDQPGVNTKSYTRAQAEQKVEIMKGSPLLLYTKSLFSGSYSGSKSKLTYDIAGGKSPYAVSIDWGDGSAHSLDTFDKSGNNSAGHVYKKAGQYSVKISATDQLGNQALIQTIMVVNGRPENAVAVCPEGSTSPSCIVQNQLLHNLDVIWPAFIVATFMAFSFWLGERVVYARINKRLGRT